MARVGFACEFCWSLGDWKSKLMQATANAYVGHGQLKEIAKREPWRFDALMAATSNLNMHTHLCAIRGLCSIFRWVTAIASMRVRSYVHVVIGRWCLFFFRRKYENPSLHKMCVRVGAWEKQQPGRELHEWARSALEVKIPFACRQSIFVSLPHRPFAPACVANVALSGLMKSDYHRHTLNARTQWTSAKHEANGKCLGDPKLAEFDVLTFRIYAHMRSEGCGNVKVEKQGETH